MGATPAGAELGSTRPHRLLPMSDHAPEEDENPLLLPLAQWYATHARELPWRSDPHPWAVLVSEVMLQQTPVARVLPVFAQWLSRWPTPADLAAEPSGEAVRAWGRLGYPRRALRLHAAATAIVERHNGQVPGRYEALIELPGVGDYTAAAVASFAFDQAHAVLDTNVRRVLVRAIGGAEFPPPSVTRAERTRAESLIPSESSPVSAARWAISLMELGALLCTADRPDCDRCPISGQCAWLSAGKPAYAGPPRRTQKWHGTDRQCRGRLLEVLRAGDSTVPKAELDVAWADPAQRARCLETLIADGLIEAVGDQYALPS